MRTDVEAQCYNNERRTHTLWYQYRLHWWQNRAEIPTRHERCIERWCQTRIRGTGYSITAYKSFRIDVPIVGKNVSVLLVHLSRNYISFSFSLSFCLGSICSIMFVQAPALMVQQRSENSEEDSEEEGTGDVLQVDRSFAF